MSPEELILRAHFGGLGKETAILVTVEKFHHENLFRQMGIHTRVLEKAVDTLVRMKFLERTTVYGSQAGFNTTRWIYRKANLEDAIHALRNNT